MNTQDVRTAHEKMNADKNSVEDLQMKMDKNAEDEKLITCIEGVVSTCKKLLKETMQQTNENSSKILSGFSKDSDFEGIDEQENTISITALKAQLDTKLFLENECVDMLTANKQLRVKLHELERKQLDERKKFQIAMTSCEEKINMLKDKLTKLSNENNNLKRKIIPTLQNKHAAAEKERLLLKHQLHNETNSTSASSDEARQIKIWKERYKNEKIKRLKLSMKLQQQDTSFHDTNYKRKRMKGTNMEGCKITNHKRSDGNATPATEHKRQRKKSLNLSWKC